MAQGPCLHPIQTGTSMATARTGVSCARLLSLHEDERTHHIVLLVLEDVAVIDVLFAEISQTP
jgi:hypothetical protein